MDLVKVTSDCHAVRLHTNSNDEATHDIFAPNAEIEGCDQYKKLHAAGKEGGEKPVNLLRRSNGTQFPTARFNSLIMLQNARLFKGVSLGGWKRSASEAQRMEKQPFFEHAPSDIQLDQDWLVCG